MSAKPLPQEDLDHILRSTAPLWEEARGQRIFITGGTGFFGTWLTESFSYINRELSLNSEATILTREPAAFARKAPHVVADHAVHLLEGDVCNFTFPQESYPFVIHAATQASAKQAVNAPLEMLNTILEGTRRTLDFAIHCGARRFLLTSSGAVYGKQASDVTHVSETITGAPDPPDPAYLDSRPDIWVKTTCPDPLDPASVYAEGKRTAELMCALYSKAHGLDCKIARCWAFSGPHLALDAHFAIGNFIGDVLAGRPIQIGGDGTPRRSYLYASDLTIWLWTMLFRAPTMMPINVGSAEDVSIYELAQRITQALGAATEIHVARQPTYEFGPSRYVPSVDRAAQVLGLKPTISLDEGIRKMAGWYRSAQA